MSHNPYDKPLELTTKKVTELRAKLKVIREEIKWYETTDLQSLNASHSELIRECEIHYDSCNRLLLKVQDMEGSIHTLSKSIKSLWNPKNWFNKHQRDLRGELARENLSLKTMKKNSSRADYALHRHKDKMINKTAEIEKYKHFNFDVLNTERMTIANLLSKQVKDLEQITTKKKQVDIELAPVVKQIIDAEHKKSEATTQLRQARTLDIKLTKANNSYERSIVHRECEDKFKFGNPRKIISQKEAEIRRIDRDLSKLNRRAASIANNAAKIITKLILDGNNICYQGDVFIGLAALKSLTPTLARDYEVVLVFDASIRRLTSMSDVDIRNELDSNIQVHVVATSIKADETVLDLANFDDTTFIISNDRFAEFGDKVAVQDQRIIRHEIVAGQILIHDLKVSESFVQ